MQICKPHWDQLRAAIAARGLDHLIAKDGETAAANLQADLSGAADDSNYDPLMNANWMISNRALEYGGLYLMAEKPGGGHYCPLCEVDEHMGKGAAVSWIEGCTDAVRQHCVEKKFVAGVQ